MISEDRIMGTYEAAEYLGISTQAFSNLRSRNKGSFPEPIVVLSSTPIFDKQQIKNWASNKGRKCEEKSEEVNNSDYKSIMFCGRQKVGKSFLVSMFFENPHVYRMATSLPEKKINCPIKCVVSNEITSEVALFCSKDSEDIIKSPIDAEKILLFIEDIYKNMNSQCYIELHLRPSLMANNLMNKCNLKTLVITDMYKYGNELVTLTDSDIAIVVTDDSNGVKLDELEGLIDKLKPYVLCNKLLFMHRMGSVCDNVNEYNNIQNNAKIRLSNFNKFNTEVIGIPAMNPNRICFAETWLSDNLVKKLEILLTSELVNLDEMVKEVRTSVGSKEEVIDFVVGLINRFSIRNLVTYFETAEYTLFDFKNETHGRTIAEDNYRILESANRAIKKSIDFLCDTFIDLNYNENWKQIISRFVFTKLIESVKTKSGFASESRIVETFLPVNLCVIESILAEDIVNKVINNGSLSYIELLKELNIRSKTWSYIDVNMNEKDILKVNLITRFGLTRIKSSNLEDMILSRYVLGLQTFAEYHIWEEILKIFDVYGEELEAEVLDKL